MTNVGTVYALQSDTSTFHRPVLGGCFTDDGREKYIIRFIDTERETERDRERQREMVAAMVMLCFTY